SGSLDSSLSFDGTDIIVYPSSAYTTDGAVHQLAKTDSGFVALDGSGFAGPTAGATVVDRNGTLSAFAVSALDRQGNQVNDLDTLGRRIPPTPGPAPATVTPPASTASL